MINSLVRYALLCGFLGSAVLLKAEELTKPTVNAWEQYLRVAEARMNARLNPGATFMWMDEEPGRRMQVKQGKLLVEPVAADGSEQVPGGLIHDWSGAAFIPNTTLEKYFSVTNDYDHYPEMYQPSVVASHTQARIGGKDYYSMRLLNKSSFLVYAVDTQDQSQTFAVDADRAYGISQSVSIREIRNYGKPNEYELSEGRGAGFIWRMCTISRYEQRDGGVYVELEAIALTRDIPGSLRWLVRPIVARMSRNSLTISLTQTRAAVCSRGEATTISETTGEGRNGYRGGQ
jgi:hypothetical protein